MNRDTSKEMGHNYCTLQLLHFVFTLNSSNHEKMDEEYRLELFRFFLTL